jgi:very-short-patch-repair endonuclease
MKGAVEDTSGNKENARELRSNLTIAERTLWYILRRRHLLGYRFRRQVPVGRYIVDFLCYEARLIIELDGGQHNMPTHIGYDNQRTFWLESQGFTVLRFWNNDVLMHFNVVQEEIFRMLSGLREASS